MTDDQAVMLKAAGHTIRNEIAKIPRELHNHNHIDVAEIPAPVVQPADMTPIADAIRELSELVKAPPVTYSVEPATVQAPPINVDMRAVAQAIEAMAQAIIQQGEVLAKLIQVLSEKRAPRTLRIREDGKDSIIQEE